MPSLGLLVLASVIRRECENIEIDFFDYEVNNDQYTPNFSVYDVIGLSGTSVHIPHVNLLIKDIRLKNSEALETYRT